MGFQCGLVGLPNSGKSTIFNSITNQGVEASAYPFCTIDPHVGIIKLEDERLDFIYQNIGSAQKTPTILEFVDIAGLVKGASKGEGLGNQFLSHIGRVDAIAHIIRCFSDPNVSHPYETLDPIRDTNIVTLELILKDIEILEKRISKLRTIAKSGDLQAKKLIVSIEPLLNHLSTEKEIRTFKLNDTQKSLVREYNLLTAKPVIIIANVDEANMTNNNMIKELSDYADSLNTPCLPFYGKIQAEIAELDQNEQLEFLQAMGLTETALQKILKAGYNILNLITFFTANEKESHAWTIPTGTKIQKAAGKVHTDFEKGFIKADIIQLKELKEHGSIKKLHELGLVASHGRDYLVQDGDLVYFRIK
jgi:GTP-binding protein YchF